MPLTETQIRAAKAQPGKPLKLADGRGLSLFVFASGRMTWRLYLSAGGRDYMRTLGQYPALGLREARRAADAARVAIRAEAADRARAQAEADGPAFGAVKADWLDSLEKSGVSDATRKKALWLVEALAPLDPRPIRALRAAEIYAVLKPFEAMGKFETALRLRSTASRVFRYAGARGLVDADPTALLQGAIVAPKPKPRAAIVDRDGFAGLMRAVAAYHAGRASIVRDGLLLLALTAARPGELRLAQWGEFDLDRAEWKLPVGRMKTRQPHRAPLSSSAVAILRRLAAAGAALEAEGVAPSPFVLPSPRAGRALSDAAFNVALRAMGYGNDEASAHGFRASFSTLANESGLWAFDAIERQLAHQDASEVRRAYHRADYFDERRRLMEWWAREIEAMIGGAIG